MKILSQPNVDNWSITHTCTKCDAKLEVDDNDIKVYHYDGDFREPAYDSYSASCPVCGDSFNVLSNSIPKLIQIRIKNRCQGSYYNR